MEHTLPTDPQRTDQNRPSHLHDPWVQYPRPNGGALMRLFCFPSAGGGAVMYRQWPVHLLPDLEVCSVQLPGRENRRREEPFRQLSHLVPPLAEAILPHLDKPFAFFGHSMGALIAFELARQLSHAYDIFPAHLFVSSHPAPHLPSSATPMHTQSDELLLEEMYRLGGTPQAVLSNQELMQLLLPTVRADLELCETYNYTDTAPLSCPITAFGGSHDTKVTSTELRAWRSHTRGPFAFVLYPGGHFYLLEANFHILQRVRELLEVR